MTKDEKIAKCEAFFANLCKEHPEMELLASCNKDMSKYLCPAGTTNEVTYMGKPEGSYRPSDHWNWFASTVKCPDRTIVQCRNIDMPWARHREQDDNHATRAIYGICVAKYEDGVYHVVFGEKFDRKTKTWSWVE